MFVLICQRLYRILHYREFGIWKKVVALRLMWAAKLPTSTATTPSPHCHSLMFCETLFETQLETRLQRPFAKL
jgi:hypothetical protein